MTSNLKKSCKILKKRNFLTKKRKFLLVVLVVVLAIHNLCEIFKRQDHGNNKTAKK